MRIKLIRAIRKPPWFKVCSSIVGIALTIALVLTFLPIQIDIDGLLSIKLSHSRAAADNHTTNIYASASDGDFPNSAGTYNAVWTDLDCTPDPVTYMAIGQSNLLDAAYEIKRGFIFFDTSTVSAGATITAASLNFYGQQDLSTTDFNITIQTGQPTYPHNPAVAGDYAKGNYSGDLGHLSTSGFTTSGYNTITLNSYGIGNITKGGETKFFIRSDREIAGTVPTSGVGESVYVYCSEQAGTSKDPYLAITYTLPFLDGWDQRVEITIDAGDIDADLTNFPVLLYLSNSTSGINNEDVSFVFDELGSDANRKKIAVTKADGTTQMHVEIEKWDDSTEQAWLWVSNTTWAIDDATNTTLYLYFDADHADNTAYVRDTNDAVVDNVWDANFLAVYHMADGADTSHIYDSSSVDRDGTKKGAAEPAVTTSGKIANAQVYDATPDDYITGATCSLVPTGSYTLEGWFSSSDSTAGWLFTQGDDTVNTNEFAIGVRSLSEHFYLYCVRNAGSWYSAIGTSDIVDGTSHYFTGVYANGAMSIRADGVEEDTETYGEKASATTGDQLLGVGGFSRDSVPIGNVKSGTLDELRVSNTARSAAWVKATYETSRDHLLDWGAGETPSPEITNTPAAWAIGIVQPSDIRYFSADNNQDNDYALITNTGDCAVTIQIQGQNIEGGSYDWALASSAGNQSYSLYANSGNGSSAYNIEAKTSSYSDLCTALAVGSTYRWSMNFTAPTAFHASDDGNQKSCTVTLVASAP